MSARSPRWFRTPAQRVTLGGLGLFWASTWTGMIWQATTGAWPGQSFPQGPVPFFAVAGLLGLVGGTVWQAVDGVRSAVRWWRGRKDRSDRTGG